MLYAGSAKGSSAAFWGTDNVMGGEAQLQRTCAAWMASLPMTSSMPRTASLADMLLPLPPLAPSASLHTQARPTSKTPPTTMQMPEPCQALRWRPSHMMLRQQGHGGVLAEWRLKGGEATKGTSAAAVAAAAAGK